MGSKARGAVAVLAAAVGVLASLAATRAAHADAPLQIRRTIEVPADGVRRHAAVVTTVAMPPQGKLIAAAGDDHVIRLWNMDDGSLVTRLAGHRDWIRAMSFCPDGETLISSGNDGQVLLWNVRDGRLQRRLASQPSAVDALVFSHDGKWVATAGFDGAIWVHDVATGVHRELACACRDIRSLAISGDDRHLAAGGRDGVLRVWDLASDTLVHEEAAHTRRIRAVIFAADDAQLITGGEDGLVRIWNWKTDSQASVLPRRPVMIMSLVLCGPQLLATASSDNAIRLWDLTTRSEIGQLTGHAGSVATLAYRDGVLVSGGYDTFVRLWTVLGEPGTGLRSADRAR